MDSEYTEADVSAVATLGVEVPISTGGTLRLGMSSAWPRGQLEPAREKATWSDPAVLSTAELGLSYDFENETSVKLNYRLIDFDSEPKLRRHSRILHQVLNKGEGLIP